MFRRSRHTAAPTRLPDDQLSIAWQVCSLLLDYPSEALLARLEGELAKAHPEECIMHTSTFADSGQRHPEVRQIRKS